MTEATKRTNAHDERLCWAWNQIELATKESRGVSERYGTLARKLPSLLQTSGLGQTLAFLYSKRQGKKGPTGDALLLSQIGQRLAGATRTGLQSDPSPIMKWLTELSPDGYRRASAEARICADWLKRFAEGRLGEEREE